MSFLVKINKEDINYIKNIKARNIITNNNDIIFETNDKSLNILFKRINDINHLNLKKKKIKKFIKNYLISIIFLLLMMIIFLINFNSINNYIFVNENTYDVNVINYLESNTQKKLFFKFFTKDLRTINKEIRKNFYYYEWINIVKSGSNVKIIIDKQDELTILDEKSKVKGDIISSIDGIVRYYFIKEGVCLIKDNESVRSGDILVSGNRLYKSNKVDYIHPVGIVLVETVTKENIKVKKEEVINNRTGRIKIIDKISIFGININKKTSFNSYDFEVINIKNDFFKLYTKKSIIYYETQKIINNYSYDEANYLSKRLIYKYFDESKIHQKEEILEVILLQTNDDNEYYYFTYNVRKIVNASLFKAVFVEEKK